MEHRIHIISKLDLGGAERVALNLCKLKQTGVKYHLYGVFKSQSEFSANFIREAKDNGIIVHQGWVSNRKLSIMLFPFSFLLTFLRFKPSIIHVHTELPDLAVYLFYKLFGFLCRKTLLVRTIHSTKLWTGWGKIGEKVELHYLKRKHSIAISETVKQSYEQRFHTSGIPLIYNGVDEVQQEPYTEVVPSKINILFAGRLSREKGIDVLIRIISHFQHDSRFCFHIIGSGEYESELQKMVGTFSNVSLKSKVYNLSRYLGSFDYLLIPSLFEGFGLLCVEASFAKVPCIIHGCSGLSETLPDNWKLKVMENNEGEYIKLLSEIGMEVINRKEAGNIAFDYVKANFSIEKMQQNYERLYIAWMK